jgi:uncharacterized RDD family membrane protein YckC
MKCQGCGHDYPSTLTRCTHCGQLSHRRAGRPSQSRLLEFPRKARVASESSSNETSLPAWRVELNEKVKAIKARRSNGAEGEPVPEQAAQTDAGRAITPQVAGAADLRAKPRNTLGREASTSQTRAAASLESQVEPPTPARPALASNNAIVEAALTRVRRATENASRATLPKIEPARPLHQSAKTALALDKEATARALQPAVEVRPHAPAIGINQKPAAAPAPLPNLNEAATARIDRDEAQPPEPEKPAAALSSEEVDTESLSAPAPRQTVKILTLDELEPIDYLEAEIRKVDQVLSREFARNDSPSVVVHLTLNIIDLLVMALCCSPFLALVVITNGSYTNARTRLAMAAIILLVSFFYLALTQCLGGKTFGMMLTNTRIADARTLELPTSQRALVRTIGYFIAAVPALIGLLWAVSNRSHRGWQDYLSGTVVTRDF